MYYALNADGKKIEPCLGGKATCPLCKTEVKAKCGTVNAWHWAHTTLKDCDIWKEPETLWHIEMKSLFDFESREVVQDNHRADVLNKGHVLEFQRSSISAPNIFAREMWWTAFYPSFAWVLCGSDFQENFQWRKIVDVEKNIISFRWKHARRSWLVSKQKKYIHFYAKRNLAYYLDPKGTIYPMGLEDVTKKVNQGQLKKERVLKKVNLSQPFFFEIIKIDRYFIQIGSRNLSGVSGYGRLVSVREFLSLYK